MTADAAHHASHPIARDNARFLQQGVDLLERITDDQYAATRPPVFVTPVGAHIRHILDHFDCLLEGRDTGRVDYDLRRRDRRVESDRAYALSCLRATIDALRGVRGADGDEALEVRLDSGDTERAWGRSSLTRELQFLSSHTIHHYALVAAILQSAGCAPQPGFGVSPSTLRFERRRAQQAG